MKRIFVTTVIICLISTTLIGQRYISKNGHVWFYSDAPLETIEAHNKQANAALDTQTGALVFKILMKSFMFEKALMQEHFNENYVESDKFPNATFKGKITNLDVIDFSKPDTYDANVEGEITIHGITKKVSSKGVLIVTAETIHCKSKFDIAIADYDISIPGAVAGKIAEVVEVKVDVKLKELKK